MGEITTLQSLQNENPSTIDEIGPKRIPGFLLTIYPAALARKDAFDARGAQPC